MVAILVFHFRIPAARVVELGALVAV